MGLHNRATVRPPLFGSSCETGRSGIRSGRGVGRVRPGRRHARGGDPGAPAPDSPRSSGPPPAPAVRPPACGSAGCAGRRSPPAPAAAGRSSAARRRGSGCRARGPACGRGGAAAGAGVRGPPLRRQLLVARRPATTPRVSLATISTIRQGSGACEPQSRAKGCALQLLAVQGADPRAREPDGGRAGGHVEFQDQAVGEEVADLPRLDLGAFRRGALSAQALPVGMEHAAGGMLHRCPDSKRLLFIPGSIWHIREAVAGRSGRSQRRGARAVPAASAPRIAAPGGDSPPGRTASLPARQSPGRPQHAAVFAKERSRRRIQAFARSAERPATPGDRADGRSASVSFNESPGLAPPPRAPTWCRDGCLPRISAAEPRARVQHAGGGDALDRAAAGDPGGARVPAAGYAGHPRRPRPRAGTGALDGVVRSRQGLRGGPRRRRHRRSQPGGRARGLRPLHRGRARAPALDAGHLRAAARLVDARDLQQRLARRLRLAGGSPLRRPALRGCSRWPARRPAACCTCWSIP